jgi:hypothetical protein
MLHVQGRDPGVECNVWMGLRDRRGRVVPESVREGHNVWTLTGREYLVGRMSLASVAPTRVEGRSDCVYYIGIGSGVQTEVESVSALVTPVEYRSGSFLAPIQTPPTFPADTTSTPRTSVRYIREYASNEISLGADVVVTEAGLYTDGDPSNNDAPPAPVTLAAAGGRAPLAYHSFEPITKFLGFTFVIIWEVRIT